MSDSLADNPFARLFPSVEAAEQFSRNTATELTEKLIAFHKRNMLNESSNNVTVCSSTSELIPKEFATTNSLIEQVFGLTLNKNSSKKLLFLNELAATFPSQCWIDCATLEQALFERLLLENPASYVLEGASEIPLDNNTVQTEVLSYLFECFKRLENLSSKQLSEGNDINEMKTLVLRNVATALKQPQLYENQDLNSQVLKIFYETDNSGECEINNFFNGVVNEIIKEEPEPLLCVTTAFEPIFTLIRDKIAHSSLITFEDYIIFSFFHVMSSNKYLAEALIDYSTPKSMTPGNVFSDTLLGSVLCLSCLPKTNEGFFEFFDKPLLQPPRSVEDAVWISLNSLHDHMHQLLLSLLKVSLQVRHKILKWLGDCLHANASRGKLWNSHGPSILGDLGGSVASDGFMLNLGAVLLRLCEPFISDQKNAKFLKIDPTYCAANVNNDEAQKRNIHMHQLHTETCFVPIEENESRPVSENFNFITECFFLAQKCLDIGFRVCVEKLVRLNHDLARIQRAYNDVQAGGGGSHEVAEAIQERMESEMTRYLSLRAVLIEPRSLDLLTKLHIASSQWLIQVLLDTNNSIRPSYALSSVKTLSFPLPDVIPNTLKCIPEFLLENLSFFLIIARKFSPRTLEENGFELLEPMLTLIIIFMGSTKRLRNPHLRAGLAESLESLLPNLEEDIPMNPNPLGTICREQIFQQHEHREHIIPSLLDVFVGIEMTGQSVQFEQKFNYRRPMYVIMDYLWKIEDHRNCFKKLAVEAEKNMEAVTPPIFLRFLNLLINDAVFLLDDALSNIAQLKSMQIARDSGEWTKLSPREREQNEALFQQTGMLAKFDNVLGRWTIHTLEFLTTEIKSIFSHSTLVDRVAAMLNYFLQNLVGPNKKNFKVKDQDEYDFKPGVLVIDICKIYVNLYKSDAFCVAVSQDGRSYNSALFKLAEDVLARIGGGVLIADLEAVHQKVSKLAIQQQTEEELLADAPEEFLDPIMSTLMTDPVILPSSRAVVERATIARHLLSDQSDPFNRAPLTMEMIKPAEELKARINAWIEQKKRKRQYPTSSEDIASEETS